MLNGGRKNGWTYRACRYNFGGVRNLFWLGLLVVKEHKRKINFVGGLFQAHGSVHLKR